jgi:hypothetical protein
LTTPIRLLLALGLLQVAVLLLNAEHLPGPVQHHEVDLAIEGVAAVLAGPVHAVEDGVVAGQGIAQLARVAISGPWAPARARRVRSEGMILAIGW